MDREIVYFLLPVSSLLWMLGGKYWKGWRRFVLPVLICATCLFFYLGVAKSVTVALVCLVVTSLPYGKNSPMWQNILTAASYCLVSMPLGFTWMQVIPFIAFISTYILSRKYGLHWKLCEGVVGFSFVIALVELIYKKTRRV